MASAKSFLKTIMPTKVRANLRRHYLSMNVNHIHGPRNIYLAKNQAAVTCVLKNGQYYVGAFIEHYLNMGFQHIFFMDNGSSDDTVSIAKRYDHVSLCQSTLPISSNQRLFKKYLAEQTVRGGWCLDADADEFFDFPFSEVIGLEGFLEYLNLYRYTAVITQLLDMFSDRPLSYLIREQTEDVRSVYKFFDLTNITKTNYRTSELVVKHGHSNQAATNQDLLWGGIRKTLYGNNCLLTKHSLFFPEAKIDLFPHVHFTNKANIADVSGVMLHYKLTSNAMGAAVQNKDNFIENQKTYSAFIETIQNESNRVIKQDTAQEFISAADLTRHEFLSMSPIYEEYVKAKETTNRLRTSSSVEGNLCLRSKI
jgi:glycosyltransferase involved in cell wall biosynthesis